MPQNPIPSTLFVTRVLAGNGVTISPTSGTGEVTLNVGAETTSKQVSFIAPLPADLVSVVNAVTPSNVALTLAAQPSYARKLQYRIVIGTTTTTAITAGTLTVVGVDQDGNALNEVVSLITTSSKTVKSAYAWATVTSATVASYAASGSGTGNTIGIGVSNDFGVPTDITAVSSLACTKASKNTRTVVGSGTAVTTWTNVVTDDVASTATVDAVARTIAPTTAPDANGLIDFVFTYSYSRVA